MVTTVTVRSQVHPLVATCWDRHLMVSTLTGRFGTSRYIHHIIIPRHLSRYRIVGKYRHTFHHIWYALFLCFGKRVWIVLCRMFMPKKGVCRRCGSFTLLRGYLWILHTSGNHRNNGWHPQHFNTDNWEFHTVGLCKYLYSLRCTRILSPSHTHLWLQFGYKSVLGFFGIPWLAMNWFSLGCTRFLN